MQLRPSTNGTKMETKPPQADSLDDKHMDRSNEIVNNDSPIVTPVKEDANVVRIFNRSFNSVILVTHVNICLYATCFWIQIGALPYLSKKLGVDPILFGYLQTTFAVVQLCGGPLFGRFGDLFGGRAAMTLAFISAAVTYGLLGLTGGVTLLFISRLPSVFMHAVQGGQMVVTDLTDSNNRAAALGKLGLSYGVGIVLGPFLGGIITKMFDEQHAAFVACAGSLLSIWLCVYFIPKQTKRVEVKTKEGAVIFDLSKIMSIIRHPDATRLLLVKLVSGIPIGVFQSMFAIIAMEKFDLGPDQNGFLMSYIGILTMITQGVGIGYVSRRVSELSLIQIASFVLVVAYLLLSLVQNIYQLCLVLIPLSVGLTLMNVVISSALTNTVSSSDTGTILGVNMAVNSLIRSVSPFVGGYMLTYIGFPAFGYLGCVNSSLTALYLVLYSRRKLTQ